MAEPASSGPTSQPERRPSTAAIVCTKQRFDHSLADSMQLGTAPPLASTAPNLLLRFDCQPSTALQATIVSIGAVAERCGRYYLERECALPLEG